MQPPPDSVHDANQMLLNVSGGDSVASALRKVGPPEQLRALLPGLEFLIDAAETAVDIIRNLFSDEASGDAATVSAVGAASAALPAVASPSTLRSPATPSTRAATMPAPKADHARSKLLEALDKLPHYRDVKHIAGELAQKYEVDRVPRKGSRGNAILYVLQGPARLRPIQVDDLLYALHVMGVFEPEDDGARQKLSWEILALKNKGWPVERDLAKNLVILLRGGTA